MAVLIALRLVIMLRIYGGTPADASNDDVNASGPSFSTNWRAIPMSTRSFRLTG
jgi:hypothetical protein